MVTIDNRMFEFNDVTPAITYPLSISAKGLRTALANLCHPQSNRGAELVLRNLAIGTAEFLLAQSFFFGSSPEQVVVDETLRSWREYLGTCRRRATLRLRPPLTPGMPPGLYRPAPALVWSQIIGRHRSQIRRRRFQLSTRVAGRLCCNACT